MRLPLLFALLSLCADGALAQSVPAAIYTDPPLDAAHPASMTVLHIPSHGVLINGLVYSPRIAIAGHSMGAGSLRTPRRTSMH
jgi:uncharacterized protein